MIIDSHIHLGYMPDYFNYNLQLKNLLQLMDRLNISIAINSHTLGLICGDFEKGTEDSIRAYKESDGRILSYYAFNPMNSQKCLEVIEKFPMREIFKGIKIHPSFHGVSADDMRYDAAWACAKEKNLPILAHTWDISLTNPVQALSFPARFEPYIKKYPEVTLILGHSGGRYEGIREAARLAKTYGNVYTDCAGDIYSNCFIEFLASHAGSEKILFGTDYSMMDQRNMLGVILGSGLTVEDKENILFKNASRVFNIETVQ